MSDFVLVLRVIVVSYRKCIAVFGDVAQGGRPMMVAWRTSRAVNGARPVGAPYGFGVAGMLLSYLVEPLNLFLSTLEGE